VNSLILEKNASIFGKKEVFFSPSIVNLKEKLLDFLNSILVTVWQFLSVKLNEGLVGICIGFFPQYLTSAILDGLSADTNPDLGKLFIGLYLKLLVFKTRFSELNF
jgi:hypothetical protein